jgi:hypothetical protein
MVGKYFSGKDIVVGTASQSKLSFLRTFYNATSQLVFPYLTAIIDVNHGIVQGITWDDSCVFCAPNECSEITYNFAGKLQSQKSSGQPTAGCKVTLETCNSFITAKTNGTLSCDLQVYVVWTGTDGKGRAFQSSSSRFSAFPPQNIKDRLLSLLPKGVSGRSLYGEHEVTL